MSLAVVDVLTYVLFGLKLLAITLAGALLVLIRKADM
jgi:hypothetical protein